MKMFEFHYLNQWYLVYQSIDDSLGLTEFTAYTWHNAFQIYYAIILYC